MFDGCWVIGRAEAVCTGTYSAVREVAFLGCKVTGEATESSAGAYLEVGVGLTNSGGWRGCVGLSTDII